MTLAALIQLRDAARQAQNAADAAESQAQQLNTDVQALAAQVAALAQQVDQARQAGDRNLRFLLAQLQRMQARLAQLQASAAAANAASAQARDRFSQLDAQYRAALTGLIPGLDVSVPIALLPVRLETRFAQSAPGVMDLLIRIYPDDIHQDTREPELTADENAAGRQFWEQSWRAGTQATPQQRAALTAAWTVLAQRAGAFRAAWIVRVLTPLNNAARPTDPVAADTALNPPPDFPQAAGRDGPWTRPSMARALPDRWVALGYSAGQRAFTVWGDLVVDPLPTGPSPGATLSGAALADDGMRWMVDFNEALAKGMAIRVERVAPQFLKNGIDLLVLGVKATLGIADSAALLESLLDAHHYTWGLGLVPQGTATNNTPDVKSAYSFRDTGPEVSFDRELGAALAQRGDGGDADLLAGTFGFAAAGAPFVFEHVPRADCRDQREARDMNTVLWPATWSYFLGQMMHGAIPPMDFAGWRRFFIEQVRARGPLPALRVRNQPYGVLPAMSLSYWRTDDYRPDLVVLEVSRGQGGGHAAYRAGCDLQSNGNIASWNAPAAVGGAFGADTQGAGAALFDISGTGLPDLVVFQIDNPAQDNTGYYRIGWDLDLTGAPTGGWTNPLPVPGWFGWENQGGGIAVADLNGNGRPELIVFHIDNPAGAPNHGYYRIGWDLDSGGNAARWSDPVAVPAAFAAETQGGGITLARFAGNALPDLVVFRIDRVAGGNQGFYSIGHGLDATGAVTGGWTNAIAVPGSFGDDTRGADIAAIDYGGQINLVVFYIANEAGENHGYLRIGVKLHPDGSVDQWNGAIPVGGGPFDPNLAAAGLAAGDFTRGSQVTLDDFSGFVNLLDRLRAVWRKALPGVPQAGHGDPDAFVVAALGQGALSSTVAARNLLGPDFTRELWWFILRPGDPAWWNQWQATAFPLTSALLASLGLPWDPRLAHMAYAHDSSPVAAPLVDSGPLSETEPLQDNYIAWLVGHDAADIHNRTGGPLLYRLLRHAALQAYADAAMRLRPVTPLLLEPELIDLGDMTAADLAQPVHTLTSWRYLSETIQNGVPFYKFLFDLKQNGQLTGPALAELGEFFSSLSALVSLPTAALDRLLRESLDLGSHRLDAWITACATRRLAMMRQQAPSGLHVGGYGWVENLKPRAAPVSTGFVHAPSPAHAATAAVLRSAWLSHRDVAGGSLLAVDLSSRRVRLARWLMDGVRRGQPLGALLGYRFERGLHERQLDAYTASVRALAPLTAGKLVPNTSGQALESIAASNVVDGLALLRRWQRNDIPFGSQGLPAGGSADAGGITAELDALAEAVDALSDTGLAESVFHAVEGNPLRAGSILDAISRGEAQPSELEVARTPRSGIGLVNRVLVLFSGTPDPNDPWLQLWDPGDPDSRARQVRAAAEPWLNAWAARLLGDPANIRCGAGYLDSKTQNALGAAREIALKELKLCPLDVMYSAPVSEAQQRSDLEQMLVDYVSRTRPQQVPADAVVRLDLGRNPAWGASVLSLPEALEIARAARELVTASRAAEARDFAQPGPPPSQIVDEAELQNRAGATVAALAAILPDLKSASIQTVHDALVRLYYFGMAGAAPQSTGETQKGEAALRRQAASLASQVDLRVQEIAKLGANDHLGRLGVVFGTAFRVLPRLALDNAAGLQSAFALRAAAGDAGPRQTTPWFHRIARVRKSVGRLNTLMLYAESAGTGDAMNLKVAQLPADSGDGWMAGAVPAMRGGRLSIVAHAPVPLDPAQPLAGLVVDEWTEVVPSSSEVTALTFHYDAPGACAPQAILLAVPPDPRGPWSLAALEAVLRETWELGRLRAVDPDSLADVGHFLPALYFAHNVGGDPNGDTIATEFK